MPNKLTLGLLLALTPLAAWAQAPTPPVAPLERVTVEGKGVEPPLADYFKLQPLPAAYFLWLAGILLGYSLLTTLMKRFYIRRFGWQ